MKTRITLEEAKQIMQDEEAKYHRGTTTWAMANTIVSLYTAIQAYEQAMAEERGGE
jgi:hypothetical protein